MWTNEGTLIRPGPGSQPFLCLQWWGMGLEGPGSLRTMPWTQGCQEALFTVGPWGSGRPLGWQSHPALGLCPARPGWAGWGGAAGGLGRACVGAGQVEGYLAFH